MHADRTHRPLHFLALGLAGICLTLAELPFLPWLPLVLVVYLLLLLAGLHFAGRFTLSESMANLIGLGIAVGGGLWVFRRASVAEDWAAELSLPSTLVPYLGPLLMALLCVRLFRPRSPSDFWLLQGLGLLQVALGCVLASGTLFGIAFVFYLSAALCAVAAHERHHWKLRSGLVFDPDPTPPQRPGNYAALRWGGGTALVALGLFLLSPRTDQPNWDPLARFGIRQPRTVARTGFSEDINLNRAGRIEADDTPAFWVSLTDREGHPVDQMPTGQRFRGLELDNYEAGIWRSELSWPTGKGVLRLALANDPGGEIRRFHFRVPARIGGLFLADPVHLTRKPGALPLVMESTGKAAGELFYEAGGTAVALPIAGKEDVSYVQTVRADADLERSKAWRLRDAYLRQLLQGVPAGMPEFARAILGPKLASDPELLAQLGRSPIDFAPLAWERVARLLEAHLASNGGFSYSLRTEPLRSGIDPTLDFLRRVRSGPCERFSSSLTLLLRAVGIPARIVKGYRLAERQSPGRYVVRQNAAHAWVEALVPSGNGTVDYDWIMLDPTPNIEAATEASPLTEWWKQRQRGGQMLWRELIVGYNAHAQSQVLDRIASWQIWEGWRPTLLVVFIAALGVGAWRLLPAAQGQGTAMLWRRVQTLLCRRGLVAEPGETPAELATRAGESMGTLPGEVAALHYRDRFGGMPATGEELRTLDERLAKCERGDHEGARFASTARS